MKLLHVTPHLGGGVGKAHAVLAALLPRDAIEQTFVLLEQPRDRQHVDVIAACGASVLVAENPAQVARLAAAADIVQFEFWNHPRMFECLARGDFAPMRCVFWTHISGLNAPFIPGGLMQTAARFVFTSAASLGVPAIAALRSEMPREFAVINSGFGFASRQKRAVGKRKPVVAYLGTVDFVKMHEGFFDAIDALSAADTCVSVWGEAGEAVRERARAMRHPHRIAFMGPASDPCTALSEADIFFYPLRPDHYGTAENALVEAMSLGLTPVVMNNPAEMAVVEDARTGFVARSITECTALLDMLLLLPDVRAKISRAAMAYIAETRSPDISLREFMTLWLALLSEPKRVCDFRSAIGSSPADWFAATQSPSAAHRATVHDAGQRESKGSLAHFERVFVGDASLARLRRSM